MGHSKPKQFLPLGGIPILIHTLRRFFEFDPAIQIALVLPADSLEAWEHMAVRWLSQDEQNRITVNAGGASRTESVYAGLQALEQVLGHQHPVWVGIHDGVRPFADPGLLQSAYALAMEAGAAVAAVQVKASLRKKDIEGSLPVDRAAYVEVQTPQVFLLDKLLHAYRQRPDQAFTDDASLYQQAGHLIALSEGSYDNIKITTPEDLELGEQILRRHQMQGGPKTADRSKIKLILLDVDGTLTDGGMYYTADGNEFKKFHVKDGLAISRLIRRQGLEFGLLSSGTTPAILHARATKMHIQRVYAGTLPKLTVASRWLEELALDFSQLLYVGDDLNDLPLMLKAGFSACPADACKEVKAVADWVLTLKGGEGCIRELLDEVLQYDLS